MLSQHLLARLVELGHYGHETVLVRGLSEELAGGLVLAGFMLALAFGALMASRLIAPSDAMHSFGLSLIWTLCVAAYDAARVLGHVAGPGPEAALAVFFLGLMVSAAHVVLQTSWQRGVLIVALGWAFGGLFSWLGALGIRMINSI